MRGSRQLDGLYSVFTVVLALVALAVLVTASHRGLERHRLTDEPVVADSVGGWEEIAAHGHRAGADSAIVTIVEFSDFQCPHCASIRDDLDRILEDRRDRVALVFRHFPLASFGNSVAAAVASECAADQDAFAPYRDLLFQRREALAAYGTADWIGLATEVGVADLRAFSDCLDDDAPERRVEADRRTGEEHGVRVTPTVLVNGRVFRGANSMRDVESMVDQILDRSLR